MMFVEPVKPRLVSELLESPDWLYRYDIVFHGDTRSRVEMAPAPLVLKKQSVASTRNRPLCRV